MSATSIQDLLANLTSEQANYERVAARPETWRVCFVVPSAARLWRDDQHLLLGLVQHGFEVHVIAYDEGVFEAMQARGIFTRAIPSCQGSLWRVGLLSPLIYPIVQGYLIEHPPTLVHVEEEPLLLITLLAAGLLDQRPLIVGTWRGKRAFDVVARGEALLPAPIVEPLRHVYWQQVIERLDIFLTTSREELEAIMARITTPEHRKLEVWPGASGYDARHVDPERRDLPSREELREMGEIPTSWRHLIGVAGDFEEDLDALLELIEATAKKLPGAGWILARPTGVKTSGESLEARLEKVRERVVVLEPGELGMPLFYALSDLFYVPRKRTDRIATVALEAQAMGVPCVVHDVGLNAIFVEDGETGAVLLPAASPGHTLEAITRLLLDEDHLVRAGELAKKRARNLFSRHAAHEQLMGLYDRLLSRRYGT